MSAIRQRLRIRLWQLRVDSRLNVGLLQVTALSLDLPSEYRQVRSSVLLVIQHSMARVWVKRALLPHLPHHAHTHRLIDSLLDCGYLDTDFLLSLLDSYDLDA